ncbi:MAG: hypothetical protein E6H74_02730 [Betaproteobacteria bacterium]|nr:MAG: hypothetical protein E6H74_02730 [Betaproteobacteria bacterium]
MKRRIAMIAAAAVLLAGGATVATTASARDSFSISIGAPGFAVGYATPITVATGTVATGNHYRRDV